MELLVCGTTMPLLVSVATSSRAVAPATAKLAPCVKSTPLVQIRIEHC
jgi:hypothetical protein